MFVTGQWYRFLLTQNVNQQRRVFQDTVVQLFFYLDLELQFSFFPFYFLNKPQLTISNDSNIIVFKVIVNLYNCIFFPLCLAQRNEAT